MKNIFKWLLILLIIGTSFFLIWSEDNNLKHIEPINKSIQHPESKIIEVTTLERLEFHRINSSMNNKMFMIFFHTQRCTYCEKMKKITLIDASVKKELEKNYTVVSINYTKYKHNFNKIYNLKGAPATFFFNRDGKELNTASFYGYLNPEKFLQKIITLSTVDSII